MDEYHIFQVMCLFLLRVGDVYNGAFEYLGALLGVEVGLHSADLGQS